MTIKLTEHVVYLQSTKKLPQVFMYTKTNLPDTLC
jgi:hypothetical protein